MKRMRVGTLIIALTIPILVGMISAFLSAQGMEIYGSMNKPPLSPPAWVFSVAWTVLYLMMGLSSYFIVTADADNSEKLKAMRLYAVQLVINFVWSLIFFNLGAYLVAFIWLMGLWFVVIICAVKFHGISKMAAYLLVPYIFWLTFAAYLNMGAFILNMKV